MIKQVKIFYIFKKICKYFNILVTLQDEEKDIEKQTESNRGIVKSNEKIDIQLQNIPEIDDNDKKDQNKNQLVILNEETINLQK